MEKFYFFFIATVSYIVLFFLALIFSHNRKINVALFLLASLLLTFAIYYPLFLPGWYKSLCLVGGIFFWSYCI